jgi:hypothetical protein
MTRRPRPYFSRKQFDPAFKATTEKLRQEVEVKKAGEKLSGEKLVAWFAEQGLVG